MLLCAMPPLIYLTHVVFLLSNKVPREFPNEEYSQQFPGLSLPFIDRLSIAVACIWTEIGVHTYTVKPQCNDMCGLLSELKVTTYSGEVTSNKILGGKTGENCKFA